MINKPIYSGFDRFGRFPIDPSSVFENEISIQEYINSNKTNAYPGQIISTLDGKIWMVKKNEHDQLFVEDIDNAAKLAIESITEDLGFIESDIEDLQNTKLDKNLGSLNKDKILSIDEEGDIIPIDLPETLFADNETIIKDNNGVLTAVALRRTGGGLVTADNIKDLELDITNYKITTNQKISDIENVNEDQQEEIEYVTKRINTLVGSGGYLTANNFGTNSPVQSILTNYALNEVGITDYLEIWNGTKVKNTFDGHTWVLTNTQDTTPAVFEWTDQGIDYVALATDGSAGIVKGSIDHFKVSVDMFGEMSVNGLEEALYNKVDKETGKSLSQNDFTNEDKSKVDLISTIGDGNSYLSDDGTYKILDLDSGIPEAPIDGKTYGRQNEAWAETLTKVEIESAIQSAILSSWEAEY